MNTKINVTLSDDICFKYIFSKEEILKDFLNSFFQFIREKKKVVKVRTSSNVPIYGDKFHHKIYYGDVVASLDTGEVVIIEMYRKFSRDEYKKSLAYITRLYSNQYDRGKKYKEGRKVIEINIIENNYQKNNAFLVNDYGFINKFNYGKVGEEEKEMEDVVRFMEKFLADEEIRNVYDKIVDVEWDAEERGIIKIAKNMLNKGYFIEEIIDICNLSKDEIEAL